MLQNTLKLITFALSAAALICLAVIDWTSLIQRRIIQSFNSAYDALTHASSSLSDLWSKIQSTLPDYYAVGLWGYYSSKEGASKYSGYSTPMLVFLFNLVIILESNALGTALLLLDASKAVLSRLLKLSRLTITAYIIRITATTLTIIGAKTNLLVGCFNIHCCCISHSDNPVQLDIWRDLNLSR
ncbi:uncharacterized protein P174DRAFT_457662 [Aspergillus novofumigatus IBT 16806]|uniref:Integral membrane protein n=1 Tax=Aspergillus novofumigatus (strain IBT 16806) TaxID=1392255 RepID=A0A2I1CH17_ASPN1|nr:uncharacterized protein P174DRAFT_457662 [Aspergillus novofumigatus IBT 16806]PKX96926.1 hypothetical protein P174DRAFT_457662 [Aspergillus novofumigatus IBT 16806]